MLKVELNACDFVVNGVMLINITRFTLPFFRERLHGFQYVVDDLEPKSLADRILRIWNSFGFQPPWQDTTARVFQC